VSKPAKLRKPLHNRVVGSGIERVDNLLAHPQNWRLHPDAQQQALAGVIDDVGFVRSILVNKTTGHVVDGHARIAILMRSGATEVPVEYVELDEAEEATVLATLDPIGAMAAADKAKLDDLMRQVQSDDERVQALMSEIAEREGVVPVDAAKWDDAFGAIPDEDRAPFQQMTFTLHDTQAEMVRDALKLAQKVGDFTDSPNENSNGNALAYICEVFARLPEYGNG
jgi:ParB-like chromosome segregation protein Spo0J